MRDQRRAQVGREVELALHAGDVEPGQHAQDHVLVRARVDVDALQLAVGDDVAVRDLRALREAGGAGRVLEQRGVRERAGAPAIASGLRLRDDGDEGLGAVEPSPRAARKLGGTGSVGLAGR